MSYFRKVIRITGEDSPNVRFAVAQQRAGVEPTGEVIVPGVLPWNDYVKRRATWDPIRQCIGIDAQFYEGAEALLFPPLWLNRAAAVADTLKAVGRRALGVGIDPAEGGDETSWTAVDDLGIVEEVALRTSDTSVIVGRTIAFAKQHSCAWENVVFDRGGGGKQHADTMRQQGYRVRSVGFGEAVSLLPKRGLRPIVQRIDAIEMKGTYVNRRAQMYGELRLLLDPASGSFGIPAACEELRRQLSLIPLLRDQEGRLKLPPKNRRNPDSSEQCLVDIMGCSPDRADSLVLAVHAMLHKGQRAVAGRPKR